MRSLVVLGAELVESRMCVMVSPDQRDGVGVESWEGWAGSGEVGMQEDTRIGRGRRGTLCESALSGLLEETSWTDEQESARERTEDGREALRGRARSIDMPIGNACAVEGTLRFEGRYIGRVPLPMVATFAEDGKRE